jgi:N6-adenosine-specific RNA methylase IME4
MADLTAAQSFAKECAGLGCGAILADPPWQFSNRTGKVAPEHRRLARYETLTLADIKEIPVSTAAADASHLYLWVPNALLAEGLAVMEAWDFSTSRTSSGTKSAKTAARTDAASAFIFATQPNSCCSAFAVN